jgi:hypothetical protein
VLHYSFHAFGDWEVSVCPPSEGGGCVRDSTVPQNTTTKWWRAEESSQELGSKGYQTTGNQQMGIWRTWELSHSHYQICLVVTVAKYCPLPLVFLAVDDLTPRSS